jgi:type I restriction enzyme S subunit
MLDRVRELEVILDATVANAGSLERSVLAKAFRGELVPQDPNDEPAKAMLARVSASNGAPRAGRSKPSRATDRTRRRDTDGLEES